MPSTRMKFRNKDGSEWIYEEDGPTIRTMDADGTNVHEITLDPIPPPAPWIQQVNEGPYRVTYTEPSPLDLKKRWAPVQSIERMEISRYHEIPHPCDRSRHALWYDLNSERFIYKKDTIYYGGGMYGSFAKYMEDCSDLHPCPWLLIALYFNSVRDARKGTISSPDVRTSDTPDSQDPIEDAPTAPSPRALTPYFHWCLLCKTNSPHARTHILIGDFPCTGHELLEIGRQRHWNMSCLPRFE